MSACRAGSVAGLIVLLAGLLVGTHGLVAQVPESGGETVVHGDSDLVERTEGLLPILSERTGLPVPDTLRVEWSAQEDVDEFLDERLRQDWPGTSAVDRVRSFHHLGLLPPGTDLIATLREVHLEQATGFFDFDRGSIHLVRGLPSDIAESTLVHELVHALQDAAHPLPSLIGPEVEEDRRAAARAALEAHATLISVDYMAGFLPGEGELDLTELGELGALIRAGIQAMGEESPALRGAPRFLQEVLLFPYLDGVEYMEALWSEVGEVVAPVADRLPPATRDVIHPRPFLASTAPRALPGVPAVRPGGARDHSGVLGALGTRTFLNFLGWPGGDDLIAGWVGDRFVLDGEDDVVRWLVLWRSEEEEETFRRAVEDRQDSLPGPATVRGAVPVESVEGFGTILCVGPPGEEAPSCDPGEHFALDGEPGR